MSEQDYLQIARRVFEAWNAHDTNRYAALLHPGHVWETDTLPQTVRGRDAARQTMLMYLGLPRSPLRHRADAREREPRRHPVAGHGNPSGRAHGDRPHSPTSRAPRLHGQRDQERKVRPCLAVLGQRSPTPAARDASESSPIRGDWIGGTSGFSEPRPWLGGRAVSFTLTSGHRPPRTGGWTVRSFMPVDVDAASVPHDPSLGARRPPWPKARVARSPTHRVEGAGSSARRPPARPDAVDALLLSAARKGRIHRPFRVRQRAGFVRDTLERARPGAPTSASVSESPSSHRSY